MRLFLVAALLAGNAVAQAGEIEGAASAGDGDNLNFSVRIFGIDAPERDQTCKNAAGVEYACGQMARDALGALVKNKNVRCTTQTHDRNNRPVAICDADGVDLGAALVDQGLAIASRSFSNKYVPNEERAKAEKRGLWAGDFVWPRDWRDRKKKDDPEALFLVPPQPCPPPPLNPGAERCLIKGNHPYQSRPGQPENQPPWPL